MTETAAPPAAAEPKTATIDAPAAGEKAPSDFMSDIIGELQGMDEGKAPEPPPKPSPKAQPKPEQKPASKPSPETKVEKPDQPKPDEQPAEPVKPVKAAELRNAYEGLKKRVREELEPEVQRLRSKIQEQEKSGDPAPLVEKIKTLEERNAQLEKQIEYVDYTQSKDFIEKHHEPYRQAWEEAVAEFRELEVIEKTPAGIDEMGEPVFKVTTRPADESDLIKLGAMKISEMDRTAKKMFEDSASRAINHVQKLRQLVAARNKAIKEAQQKAGEWKMQQQSEMSNRTKQLASLWEGVTKTLEEKLPRAYKPDESDDVDKEAFTRGFALADLLFLGEAGLTPDQVEALPTTWKDSVKAKQPMTDSQRVQLHAIARLKMANHDRQLAKLKVANDRIKELEKELAEFRKSEPEAGGSSPSQKGGSKDFMEEIEDEIRALDR